MTPKMQWNLSEADTLRIELERAKQWGETLRQLNEALEARVDLKERKIAHLEETIERIKLTLTTTRKLLKAKHKTIADLRHQVVDLMADLANARRILACGITEAQKAKAIGVGDD